jgi:hypothetical protein
VEDHDVSESPDGVLLRVVEVGILSAGKLSERVVANMGAGAPVIIVTAKRRLVYVQSWDLSIRDHIL